MKLVPFLSLLMIGCASFKQAAHTVLDVVQTTCILTHADSSSEDAIKNICAVDNALGPALHDLIGAHKTAGAAQRKLGIKPDAGACL